MTQMYVMVTYLHNTYPQVIYSFSFFNQSIKQTVLPFQWQVANGGVGAQQHQFQRQQTQENLADCLATEIRRSARHCKVSSWIDRAVDRGLSVNHGLISDINKMENFHGESARAFEKFVEMFHENVYNAGNMKALLGSVRDQVLQGRLRTCLQRVVDNNGDNFSPRDIQTAQSYLNFLP